VKDENGSFVLHFLLLLCGVLEVFHQQKLPSLLPNAFSDTFAAFGTMAV
jgi:hypothetical protein